MIYHDDGLSFRVLNVAAISHPGGTFDVEGRSYGVISFRLSGQSVFEADGKRIVIQPGDMIYIPAHMPYKVEYSVSNIIAVHLLNCSYGETEKITTPRRKNYEVLFRQMERHWKEHHSVNRIKACLFDVLAHLEEEADFAPHDADFLCGVQYLAEHYADRSLNVEKLCDTVHISRSGLQRKFRRNFGITAKQYITKLRINKAVDLLTEGNASVK